MKKYITTLLMAAMLTVTIPALATTSFAQRQNCDSNNRQYRSENRRSENRRSRNNDQRYQNDDEDYRSNEQQQYYNESGYYQTNQPNVYRRHNKAFNFAVSTGAGAIIGALLGGKKGALIGAGAGVVTGAIITKKQKSNRYRYGY